MPTVIDSLVLEFGLDPNNFNVGQQSALATLRHFEQEATRSAKGIETETKRVTATLMDFRREAITTLGVFFGGKGIKDFITDITNLDASTERLSRIFNIPSEKIGAWQNAFRMMGGTANDANAALSALNTTLTRVATTGQVGPLAPLGAFHVSPFKNQKGGLQTADNYALELADSLDKLKAAHQIDNRIAADLLAQGGIAPGLINMILEGGAKMRERLGAGARTMLPPGEAEKYQETVGKLSIALENLGRSIVTTLSPMLPWIEKLTELLRLWNRTPEEAQADSEKFTGDLRKRFGEPPAWLSEAINKGVLVRQPTGTVPATGMSRGDRNNNPGNMEYGAFAKAHGAIGTDGRFAIFPNAETGAAANDALLASKGYSGLTLSELARRWVGPDVGPGYIKALTDATGLQAGDVPNLHDPAVRARVLAGISRGEGTHLTAQFPIGAATATTAPTSNLFRTKSSTMSVQIGDVHVNAPQAKDAKGISQEIGTHLSRSVGAAAFNTGPQ